MRDRLSRWKDRVRNELERAFKEDHTPQEVAGSFSLGVFITALPTLGTGLILFVIIAAVVDRVSKIALFASVLVLNPVVKWGVYGASFWLGTRILGPAPGASIEDLSYSAGPEVIARLLVGNTILAVAFAIIGYVVCLRLVREYRRRDLEVVEEVVEEYIEEPA